jgi:hypothetical protein
MSTKINQICDFFASVLEASTPTHRPRSTFKRGFSGDHVGSSKYGASPASENRLFEVLPGIVEGLGGPNDLQMCAGLVHLADSIMVSVRYHVPFGDQRLSELAAIIGADAAFIPKTFFDSIRDGHPIISRLSVRGPIGVSQLEAIVTLRLPFGVQYWV